MKPLTKLLCLIVWGLFFIIGPVQAETQTLEDTLVNRSPLTINGYFIHFGDGKNDWIYIASDSSILGKLTGMNSDGYLTWDTIGLQEYSEITLDADKKTITFGMLTSDRAESYLPLLAEKVHPLDGFFIHYGNDVYDWIYIPYGTEKIYKLEGKDNQSGDFIWTQLDLVAGPIINSTITFMHPIIDPDEPQPSSEKKHILFAHGIGSTKESWDTFTDYAEKKGWIVHRFNVSKQGSIAYRAAQLAEKIDQLGLEENSLIAVGHSMGGLDLRYIVNEGNRTADSNSVFYRAAKTFKKIYTMATPHKGNQGGGFGTDANIDLGINNMKQFNIDNPYHRFSINGRHIPLLSLRFSCTVDNGGDSETDGVVAVKRQILNDAPYSTQIFDGTHSESTSFLGCAVETKQTGTILEKILENYPFETNRANAVFYNDFYCIGDENTAQPGNYNHYINCLTSLNCSNDAISSMMLFPSLEAKSTITVYNDYERSKRDDWTRVHVGDVPITEPLCINSFEHQSTAEELAQDIHVSYFPSDNSGIGEGLNAKISSIEFTHESEYNPYKFIFYEGNACSQGIKGILKSSDLETVNCKESGLCDNDEIRSVKLYPGINANTILTVFNSPESARDDDWTRIHFGKTLEGDPICVDTFETNQYGPDEPSGLTIDYRRFDGLIGNGLDGKISSMKLASSSNIYNSIYDILFYEGDDCTEGIKGVFKSSHDADINCQHDSSCDNDEIRSMMLYPGIANNRIIKLYNDPDGKLRDDWSRVHIGETVFDRPFCIKGFDHQTQSREENKNIHVSYHNSDSGIGDGLNGKISHIKVASSTNQNDPENIIFYEGNGCTQEIKGTFRSNEKRDKNCKESESCDNDEIRSVLLYPGIDKNTVITVYNDPDGTKDDDWARLHIGNTILSKPFCIDSFETQRSADEGDMNITVDFHRIDGPIGNGLDGKISHVTIDKSDNPYNSEFDLVFYEGNDCTQGIKGTFHSDKNSDISCNDTDACDNDEIRSLLIYPGVQKNRIIKLYNNPDGKRDDDWVRIHISEDTVLNEPFCINSFEHQTQQREQEKAIAINFHASDSGIGDGLDGKISYVKILTSSTPYDPDNIIFYEGNNCKQEIKGVFQSSDLETVNCHDNSLCDNDEIRSVLLYPGIASDTLIKLYNDPDASKRDDWTRIHLGEMNLNEPFCINGFEHQTSDREKGENIHVNYHYSDSGIGDGLNGKVSRIKISASSKPNDPDNIIFYEGNNCKQEIKGVFQSNDHESINCKESSLCDNDEIRSVLLYPGVDPNTIIKVYNNKDALRRDDWSRVHVGATTFSEPFCINGFEHQTSERELAQNIHTSHHKDDSGVGDGLNGKISHVKIDTSSDPYDPDDIVFYSDYYCSKGISGVFQSVNKTHVSCKESSQCDNDAIKSILLYPGTELHTAIRVYDNPDGKISDDYTTVYRRTQTIKEPFCIRGLEHDTSDREEAQGIHVNHHHHNGLNGKVSYIKIVPSSEM